MIDNIPRSERLSARLIAAFAPQSLPKELRGLVDGAFLADLYDAVYKYGEDLENGMRTTNGRLIVHGGDSSIIQMVKREHTFAVKVSQSESSRLIDVFHRCCPSEPNIISVGASASPILTDMVMWSKDISFQSVVALMRDLDNEATMSGFIHPITGERHRMVDPDDLVPVEWLFAKRGLLIPKTFMWRSWEEALDPPELVAEVDGPGGTCVCHRRDLKLVPRVREAFKRVMFRDFDLQGDLRKSLLEAAGMVSGDLPGAVS